MQSWQLCRLMGGALSCLGFTVAYFIYTRWRNRTHSAANNVPANAQAATQEDRGSQRATTSVQAQRDSSPSSSTRRRNRRDIRIASRLATSHRRETIINRPQEGRTQAPIPLVTTVNTVEDSMSLSSSEEEEEMSIIGNSSRDYLPGNRRPVTARAKSLAARVSKRVRNNCDLSNHTPTLASPHQQDSVLESLPDIVRYDLWNNFGLRRNHSSQSNISVHEAFANLGVDPDTILPRPASPLPPPELNFRDLLALPDIFFSSTDPEPDQESTEVAVSTSADTMAVMSDSAGSIDLQQVPSLPAEQLLVRRPISESIIQHQRAGESAGTGSSIAALNHRESATSLSIHQRRRPNNSYVIGNFNGPLNSNSRDGGH